MVCSHTFSCLQHAAGNTSNTHAHAFTGDAYTPTPYPQHSPHEGREGKEQELSRENTRTFTTNSSSNGDARL